MTEFWLCVYFPRVCDMRHWLPRGTIPSSQSTSLLSSQQPWPSGTYGCASKTEKVRGGISPDTGLGSDLTLLKGPSTNLILSLDLFPPLWREKILMFNIRATLRSSSTIKYYSSVLWTLKSNQSTYRRERGNNRLSHLFSCTFSSDSPLQCLWTSLLVCV